MASYPCYFGPCGNKRSDKLRIHCERMHPSGPDVVAAGKNVCGYTFHFLDGHTDRVWATCRGGESPSSVGHCFLCHTFFKKEGYKTIEDATAAHICNSLVGKERAKRGPKPAVGGAGTAPNPAVPVGKGMWLTGDILQEMWKESATGKPGQRALELVVEDNGDVDVISTVEKLIEDVVAKTKADNDNKRLRKENEELKSGIGPVSGEIDWSVVLNHAKNRYSPIKQWYPQLLETATADTESDEPLGEKFLLAVYGFAGDMARKLADSQKEADRLEADRVLASTEHMKAIQRIMALEADVISYQRDNNALHAELIRKSAAAVEMPPVIHLNVPQVVEAPPADCKSESAPHQQLG